MKVKELVEIINSLLAKPCVSEDYINNRLIFGSPDNEITGIALTWKLTNRLLEKLGSEGYNTIITHEAVFYELSNNPLAPKRNTFEIKANLERVKILTKYNMNILRYHTSWDDAEQGNNNYTIKKLFPNARIVKSFPCMRVIELEKPIKLGELVKDINKKLNNPFAIVVGDENKEIKRILYIAGAGAKRIEYLDMALRENCDAIISSDSNADTWYFAYDNGLALIDVTHMYAEQYGMESLANLLKQRVKGIPIKFVESEFPAKVIKF